MKWIKLTRPDDMPLWIALKQVVAVTTPIEGEGPAEACAAITTTNGNRWLVKESVSATLKQVMQ